MVGAIGVVSFALGGAHSFALEPAVVAWDTVLVV